MRSREEIFREYIEYEKDVLEYDFTDNYSSEEEAYDELVGIYNKKPDDVLRNISEELYNLIRYEDITNNVVSERYDKLTQFAKEINVLVMNEKSNDLDI